MGTPWHGKRGPRPPALRRLRNGLVAALVGLAIVAPVPGPSTASAPETGAVGLPGSPLAAAFAWTTSDSRDDEISARGGTAAPRATTARPAPGTPVAAPPPPPPPPAADQAPTSPATSGPLAGASFYGPNTGAAAAAASPGTSAEDAALLSRMAAVPTAMWLGAWSGDVAATVRREIAGARSAGGVPVFVIYNIPGRDCGGYSAGGTGSADEYIRWVEQVAGAIGSARVVVVVEPDALAQLCGDPAARTRTIERAVGILERNAGTYTYVDAGHSGWIDAATMAGRLRAAGVADADGFALNVSNFETTAGNVSYGRAVSAALGGAHFVIDTSRNGNGPGDDWCNPGGRAVGERPTTDTGDPLVDAFLWIKRAGESDGPCNGGPAAGTFWPQYAVGLMRAG